MIKQEIFDKLNGLLQSEDYLTIKSEANSLIRSFLDIKNKEKDAELFATDEEENNENETTENDFQSKQLSIDIEKLILKFKDIKSKFRAEQKALHEKNLGLKKLILKEFTELIQNEENIGEAFKKRKDIGDRWKDVGDIAKEKIQEIQAEYGRLSEQFNYNINMFKAIQEHDLKKNYSLKNQIIHELDNIIKIDNIKELQDKLNIVQAQWDEIGPTFQEHWEDLKTKYWGKIKEIQDKINDFYEAKKKVLEENLAKKKEIVEQVKSLVSEDHIANKTWKEATEKIMSFQEQWKTIGAVPKDFSETIWTEVRSYYDKFFDQKNEFFKDQRSKFSKIIDKKQEIIDKAHELKLSDDWKNTTKALINLQKDWKEIGGAGKSEQKLWAKFREACDTFFENKEQFFSSRHEEEDQNLKAKHELIEKIKAFSPSENQNDNIEALKGFSNEFNEIGNVPFKEKDNVYQAYKDALNAHYDQLKLERKEKDSMIFKSKLEGLISNGNASKVLKDEQAKLRAKINRLNTDIKQYQTNMSFFGRSAGDLLKEVEKKIQKAKSEIDELKGKLKILRESQTTEE